MESYDQTYGYQTYDHQNYGEPDIEAPEPSPYPDTPEALNLFNYRSPNSSILPLLPGNGTADLGADHAGHTDHIHFGGQEPYDDQDEDEKFGAEESEEPEMAIIEDPVVADLLGLGREVATPVDVQRLAELGCPPDKIINATSAFVDMESMGFRLNEVGQKTAGIDLNNVHDIERQQRAALDYEELGMVFTQEEEDGILSTLPGNEEALRVMEEDEGVRNNIHTHHTRMRTILEVLVRFMLAIGSRHALPDLMKSWYVLLVSNSQPECRERLLRLLTHPAVHPFYLQFLLGMEHWSPFMFDGIVHYDPKDFGSRGDGLAAYVGIAHGANDEHYSYVGSATATNPKSGAIGEVRRMREHWATLEQDAETITKLRQEGMGSQGCSILLCQEKFSAAGKWFFFASHRYPITHDHPALKKCAALVSLAETMMMVLLNSRTTGHVPHDDSNFGLVLMNRLILDGIRPWSTPQAPWCGTNVLLPMMKDPRTIWQLVLGSHRPDLPRAVERHLREYFASGREPTLPWKVCWKILDAERMKFSEGNVNAVRQLGTAILQEMGVTYRTQYHDYLLKRCVLWVAIMQQAEEQNLVTGPMHHRYRIQSRSLDWGKISEKAEKMAPADLRGKYTVPDCLHMYNSIDNQDFNQKVLLTWNWERLAGGLPKTFVQHRSIVYHPEPIQARIKQICKPILARHLQHHGFLNITETIARLSANSGSTLTALITHVVEQLRIDVSHCDIVDVVEGAWDDEGLRYSIEMEFRRTFKDAKTGLSLDCIRLWENLPAFETCWEQDSDVQMADIDSAVEASGHLSEPLPLPHDVNNQLKLLLECHDDPEVAKETRRGVPRRGPGRPSKISKKEQPFELRGEDGEPARRSLFFWKSSLPQRRKCHQARREGEARARQTGADREVECERCLGIFKRSTMYGHLTRCKGRCQGCRDARQPCLRDGGNPRDCRRCRGLRIQHKCISYSHAHLVEPPPDEHV